MTNECQNALILLGSQVRGAEVGLALETKLAGHCLLNAFSLVRATSAGMNAALCSLLGYTYHGRLCNNCHIAGGFEDMNLWVKRLPCP